MQSTPNRNSTPTEVQAERMRNLRVWMILHSITWGKFGKTMGITSNGAQKSLRGERMPEDHHATLLMAYPELTPDLLPRPEDVPFGPRPRAKDTPQPAA